MTWITARLRAVSVCLASIASRKSRLSVAGSWRGIELVRLENGSAAMIDQPLVPIVAAELHVAVGGQRLHIAGGEPQQRDVERAAAQVIDQHVESAAAASPSAVR